ncbi:Zinc finger protein DZIP1L [Ceratobasidium sp. AG-Ba]|nr:Zinc finger protein DZIP1L [Ceratobasidium sp. AG-Ba]
MESEAFSAQATLAHYWDDAPTDTLTGVKELPTVIASQPSAIWNGIYCVFATVAIYWVVQYAKASLRSRREKIAQLELRRRHGIPDSDTRPFNIAYHAASIAARDAKRQSMSAQPEQQLSAQNTTSSTNVIEGFRPQARARPPIPSFPGQPPVRVPSGHFTFAPAQPQPVSNSVYGSTRGLSHLPHSASTPSWGPGYDADGTRATSVPTVPTVATRSAFAAAAASGSRRSSGVYGSLSGASERRTWSSAARPVPTSHSTGNLSQARVRKRLYLTADEEEADDQRSGLPNDKRSRTAGWGSEAMIDGDNEPLWAQSYPVEAKPAPEQYEPQTGKTKGKRLADDADGDLRIEGKRRHTKSKSHRPKPSTVQETRGTKRERKDTDTASALNDVMPVHKRGRAGDVNLSMVQEEDDAEEEDDPTISRDPLCGGRRIGQKWTANGQEYMVGANGERLRFVTVKESRKRYYMPADSKHADSFHMIDVFVEKWLNEEQYAKAKADGLLAWQENENLVKESKSTPSDKAPEGKENQNQEERPRSISTTAITVSRAQRAANTVWNTPGQSPLTSHPMSNPFNTPPSATTPEASGPRRIRYSMGTLPPTSTINRSISVWEKQEKEAAALKILRERRKAEAAKATPAPTPAPVPAPAPVTIPSFTVTAPSETTTPKVPPPVAPAAAPAPSVKAPSFSFAPAAPKAADSAPVPASAPAPAASNPFSFAPKKDEAPKPLFPTAPAAPASAPAPVPSLFSAPAAPAPSTTSAPSPFAAPVTAAASPFGGSTPAAPNKPSPFAFGAPSTTVQPAAPAPTASSFGAPAAPPTAAPSAPSPFGHAPVAPSPAATKPMGGFTFGPTPSTTPAASSAPAPSPFGAPAPKPAANTFSFNTGTTNTAATTETKPTTGFSFGSEPKPTPGPATGGFGNTVGSSNVFGNGAPKATNAFGSTTGGTASTGFGSGFGGNNGTSAASSSLFGGNKPATTPATSGFGTQPSAPAFGAPAGAAPASTFKFGDTNGTAAPATASGFQFGAPKPTLSIPTTNSFGAPPSATPIATNGNTFTFGASTSAPTPAGAAASPATPSKPMFNLGAPAASPVMGTRQISTSKRVQRAMSKPPQ